MKDDFFRVSDNFQINKGENDLYVVDLKLIEKMFGFHEVIKKEATLGMTAIEGMNIITDIE
ncbi:Kiwa anti-phage protein KwaB-like domain-containing protein, partial [Enterobacter hormaechei]|uniref:Kiwa anti-phage protein KwaB-like domain-containing protein n=1 Tax=Enterobacter hormaechei TaxID=158836 RepID=UPI003CC5EC19